MLYVSADFSLPTDFQTNFLMLLQLIHFIAGIIWIGLLYFFNLVNIPFMKELDPGTRAKIMPGLMLRALHWFRWSALVTVLAGLAYWGSIVGSDARNGGGSVGVPMASFFLSCSKASCRKWWPWLSWRRSWQAKGATQQPRP